VGQIEHQRMRRLALLGQAFGAWGFAPDKFSHVQMGLRVAGTGHGEALEGRQSGKRGAYSSVRTQSASVFARGIARPCRTTGSRCFNQLWLTLLSLPPR
jgi:hypothetical protein